ncbi:mitochondrial fission factor homolog A isoform X2 [Esox lucius]|uniref:Mitochondrial fission factor n=2 Tax=Esox lucius TaxID=8010 RepID=A0AAY5KUS9_ESOLU|nr:mitochondrial fission factor homolog A isoform X2 [Esox lucius]XP_010893614.1 mitochondrial fission factor homolog A isoform X2 [Esox lucius]XP_010893615.1 mitochondrial fission factor homolog A isoform X2 [Esox lucius]XP_010893616.1 mitochondrial fission factor homolog A isoform X2 [Esox lucius]XP_010893617.1 mitochondrial fission factor homolog A isoform X2 [Esox lucius]
MSGATFPSSEEAEMNRLHYQLEYTEGISQRMRIPDTLKVAPENQHGLVSQQPPAPQMMQVPERIVIAGDEAGDRYSRPRDLDLIQSTPPVDLLDMKAPPRVLTLNEQPLDSLETDTAPSPQPRGNQAVHSQPRSRRERTVSDNLLVRQSGPAGRSDVSVTLSPVAPPLRVCPPLCPPEDVMGLQYSATGVLSYIQCTTRRAYQQVLEVMEVDNHRRAAHLAIDLDMTPDDSGLVDASSLRRQIVKLNRRLQLLEEENKERSKREVIIYSATVAFWLINTWIWFRR